MDDNTNLERITTRLVEMQEEAGRSKMQLMINVPLRGRVIELKRPLQVKPNTKMAISFAATRELPDRVKHNWAWAASMVVILALLFLADRKLALVRSAPVQIPIEHDSEAAAEEEPED